MIATHFKHAQIIASVAFLPSTPSTPRDVTPAARNLLALRPWNSRALMGCQMLPPPTVQLSGPPSWEARTSRSSVTHRFQTSPVFTHKLQRAKRHHSSFRILMHFDAFCIFCCGACLTPVRLYMNTSYCFLLMAMNGLTSRGTFLKQLM